MQIYGPRPITCNYEFTHCLREQKSASPIHSRLQSTSSRAKNDGVNAISDKPGMQLRNEVACSWKLPFRLHGCSRQWQCQESLGDVSNGRIRVSICSPPRLDSLHASDTDYQKFFERVIIDSWVSMRVRDKRHAYSDIQNFARLLSRFRHAKMHTSQTQSRPTVESPMLLVATSHRTITGVSYKDATATITPTPLLRHRVSRCCVSAALNGTVVHGTTARFHTF